MELNGDLKLVPTAYAKATAPGAFILFKYFFFDFYPIQILVNHKPPWHEGTSQSWREKRSSILFYSSYHRERERATLFWVLCCFEVEEKEGPRPWSGNKYNREKGQRQRENKGHIWQYKAKHILSLINKFNYVPMF
jgi:hypothetical protein